MRFVLRQGTREVLVFSRNRLVQFSGLDEAAFFLLDYVQKPETLAVLRGVLAADPGYEHLADSDGASVLMRAADLLASRKLLLLSGGDDPAPWRWVFPPTPTFDIEGAGADGTESGPLSEDEDPEEKEPERLDIKPEPVIPPEFPRLAKREGDSIEDGAGRLANQMDTLRFVGQAGVDASSVAKELVQTAKRHGNEVKGTIGGFGGRLTKLAKGGMSVVGTSSVAHEVRGIAGIGQRALKGATGGLAAQLKSIAGKHIPKGSSDVAKVFPDAVRHQGKTLVKVGTQLGQQIGESLRGDTKKLPRAQVPAFLAKVALEQGGAVKGGASVSGTRLEAVLKPTIRTVGKPPPDSIELSLEGISGAPCGGEAFRIIASDGSIRDGRLDSKGIGRLNKLPAGKARLSFPMITGPWKIVGGQAPQMTIYTVKPGDTLSKIAATYQIKPWNKIYDHPSNEVFRKKRPNPDKIYPGDVIFIPTKPFFTLEVDVGQILRLKLIDPTNLNGADDDRILIKYVFQKGNVMSRVAIAHGVDLHRDIYGHPRNVDFVKKRPDPTTVKPEDVFYIPVPNLPFVHYVVQKDDWLSKIGAAHEVHWKTDIYEHWKNAPFKAKRTNPDLIQPNDELFIPILGQAGSVEEGLFVRYQVKPCDWIERIGEAFGVDWKSDIYDNPRNAQFKALRPEPAMIQTGDVLYIPYKGSKQPEPKAVSGEFEQYTVKDGDWLSKIAAVRGLDWRKDIYEHPANAAFRKKRPNPDLIYPGDSLCLPIRGQMDWLAFSVVDNTTGKPVAGVVLKLRLPTGEIVEVTTGSDGTVRLDKLPKGKFDIQSVLDSHAFEIVALD